MSDDNDEVQQIVDEAAKKESPDGVSRKEFDAMFKCYVLLTRKLKILGAETIIFEENLRQVSNAMAKYAKARGKVISFAPDGMSHEQAKKAVEEINGELIVVKA